ncbi:unnamed protein product [Calypogeia fissa]
MPNQVTTPKRVESSVGKTAYVEIALRTATTRVDALEKELHDMHGIVAEHERRRHEAESKTCIAQRKAQDLEIRFSICDKRRKDAENKIRELETQIIEAISCARQSEGQGGSAEDATKFDRIREVFDNQAFEESKKRVDAECRAHEVMKKRAEAEAKCLEETERRVQAEIRAKQEMRVRIDEEMRNKALRSKLKDAEEKLKMLEQQKASAVNAEKRKRAEAEDNLKSTLKQAHHSLSVTDQKRKEAEGKSMELEQQIVAAEAKVLEYEKRLDDRNKRVVELQTYLELTKVEFDKKLEYSSKQLAESSKRAVELQLTLDNTAYPLARRSIGCPVGKLPDYKSNLQAMAAQELNYVKLGELQTLNADLEVTIRELKENTKQHKDDESKICNLLKLNAQLEVTIDELKQSLEQEEHAKIQLHATIEELEDTVREQTQKANQLKSFEGSTECRRLGDSLIALRVEENPLFRPEPVTDDLQRNFSSRPDSVTDDSQKQSLVKKLSQNEALIMDLRGRVEEGHTKQLELGLELKEALHSREAAEIKVDALMSQLELALHHDKERDKEFSELSGTTSFRGKKEKWGILDRFRSKIKADAQ